MPALPVRQPRNNTSAGNVAPAVAPRAFAAHDAPSTNPAGADVFAQARSVGTRSTLLVSRFVVPGPIAIGDTVTGNAAAGIVDNYPLFVPAGGATIVLRPPIPRRAPGRSRSLPRNRCGQCLVRVSLGATIVSAQVRKQPATCTHLARHANARKRVRAWRGAHTARFNIARCFPFVSR